MDFIFLCVKIKQVILDIKKYEDAVMLVAYIQSAEAVFFSVVHFKVMYHFLHCMPLELTTGILLYLNH